MPWHESYADVRVLAGPNRGGKTTAGAFELACYATGFNPIRQETYSIPNVTWGVCLTMKDQGKIMLRKLMEMLPRLENGKPNWRWWKQEGLIVLGAPYHSEIYIKQQQDGREAFYGEGCTAIWVDEGKEGETGRENFDEILIREIPGQPLKILVTLTPLNGADWLWNRLWNEKSPDYIKGTFKCHFTAEDTLIENGGFWTREQVERRAERYDDLQRDARLHGMFTAFGNRLFFSGRRLMKALETIPTGILVRPILRNFVAATMEPDTDGIAQLFRPRESGHQYLVAWDPASGSGGDNSALVVLDRRDLAIVFQARNNDMDPHQFYHQITLPACRYYGNSQLAIEVNGEGGAAAIQAAGDYENLYMQTSWDKQTATTSDKVGWRTTEPTRKFIMDSLKRALREEQWTPTRELLEEMSHIIVKISPGTGKMKAEHADGFHDDLAMATGIGLAIHYSEPIIEYPDWGKLQIRYREPGGPNEASKVSFGLTNTGELAGAEAFESWRQSRHRELPI
jgi:hypothetical protein